MHWSQLAHQGEQSEGQRQGVQQEQLLLQQQRQGQQGMGSRQLAGWTVRSCLLPQSGRRSAFQPRHCRHMAVAVNQQAGRRLFQQRQKNLHHPRPLMPSRQLEQQLHCLQRQLQVAAASSNSRRAIRRNRRASSSRFRRQMTASSR